MIINDHWWLLFWKWAEDFRIFLYPNLILGILLCLEKLELLWLLSGLNYRLVDFGYTEGLIKDYALFQRLETSSLYTLGCLLIVTNWAILAWLPFFYVWN